MLLQNEKGILMFSEYNQMIQNIDELIGFLKSLDIEAALRSYLERDYLLANQYVENYNNNLNNDSNTDGRVALIGLYELYKWIWSIKESKDFNILIPHLKMLSESAIRINSSTDMYNPVTKKQDDSTNKLIETIVAMFAIKIGSNVDLDDPVKSSAGLNPDIMFDYSGKKIAIACKTLTSDKPKTLFDNIKSAIKQIDRSSCDIGYIAINAMNILPHNKIDSNIYSDIETPMNLLRGDLLKNTDIIRSEFNLEIDEIFSTSKARPSIIFFIHGNTRLKNSLLGNISTILKGTYVDNISSKININQDIDFLSKINEFIYNRL